MIVDIVLDFFVVYFTAMQNRAILKGGTIYRGTTYFALYPDKCIPWYIILGLVTLILIGIYANILAKEEKKGLFKAEGEKLFCYKCGKQISPDSAFCPYCGSSVK